MRWFFLALSGLFAVIGIFAYAPKDHPEATILYAIYFVLVSIAIKD
jgi:hypothetical protein